MDCHIFVIYDWYIFGMCMSYIWYIQGGCAWVCRALTHSTLSHGGRAAPHVYAQRATVDESLLNVIYLLAARPQPHKGSFCLPCVVLRASGARPIGHEVAAKLLEKPLWYRSPQVDSVNLATNLTSHSF